LNLDSFTLFTAFIKMNDIDVCNIKDLNEPPFVTFDFFESSFSSFNSNFSRLSESVRDLLRFYDKHKHVYNTEKYLLDKIVYKNWNTLRKEKAIEHLRKLKRIMSSMDKLNLFVVVEKFNDTIASNSQTHLKNKIKLPSKEYCEFVLVRLLSTYKLVDYSLNLIKNNLFFHMTKSIGSAFFLSNHILFLSLIARIYYLFKEKAFHLINTYNSLRESIDKFESTKQIWCNLFQLEMLPIKLTFDEKAKSSAIENQFKEMNLDKIDRSKVNFDLNEEEFIGEKVEREIINNELNEQKQTNITQDSKKNKKFTKEIVKNVKKYFKKCFNYNKSKLKQKRFRKTILKYFYDTTSKGHNLMNELNMKFLKKKLKSFLQKSNYKKSKIFITKIVKLIKNLK